MWVAVLALAGKDLLVAVLGLARADIWRVRMFGLQKAHLYTPCASIYALHFASGREGEVESCILIHVSLGVGWSPRQVPS